MKSIRIVSDGTVNGSRIYPIGECGEQGPALTGITALVIHPFDAAGPVRATVEFVFVELDVIAKADSKVMTK